MFLCLHDQRIGQQFTGTPGQCQFLRCDRPALARPRTRSGGWRQWLELDA